jgi:hypothetical protein
MSTAVTAVAAAISRPFIAREITGDGNPAGIPKNPAPAATIKSKALWTRRGPKRSNNISDRDLGRREDQEID